MVGQTKKFTVNDGTVVLIEDAVRRGEETHHIGLMFFVHLNASDPLNALRASTLIAAGIADYLSALHSCAIEDPAPICVVDLDETKPDRELVQVIAHAPPVHELRRKFDDDLFRPLYEALQKYRS